MKQEVLSPIVPQNGARFKIYAVNQRTGEKTHFFYENGDNTLTDANGAPVVPPAEFNLKPLDQARTLGRTQTPAHTFSETDPIKKVPEVRVLKISLGLSCNYSCEYCSQRFIPRADETSKKHVPEFLAMMDKHIVGEPHKVEIWGGEPFVYWKTMQPLVDKLRVKWPNAQFSVITNGSLLDFEKCDWLIKNRFAVAMSHDGPGQSVRGPDPLEDPKVKEAVLYLYSRLRPMGKMSFNAMLNKANLSRAAVQKFFVELTGDENVPIGEGAVVSPYDEGGMGLSLTDQEGIDLRRMTYLETRDGTAKNFMGIANRVTDWLSAFSTNRRRELLGSSCGMEYKDALAVDLKGNVLTCQNVSIDSVAPNGQSHHAGNISAFEEVEVKTMTHWSHRKACRGCPVLQSCSGTCSFLEGEFRWKGCDNSYNDNIAHLVVALELITGFFPVYIEPLDGELPAYRRNLWELEKKSPRVIPIKMA